MRGILCIWIEKLLVFQKESIVCFEPKGVGGILGERTFCVFAKKKCVFLKKESIVCFEPKSVGGILGKMIFLCFSKKLLVLWKRKHCLF